MTENCHARAVKADDLPMVLSWRNHPATRRHMLTQHEITLDEHLRWFQRVQKDPARRLLLIETRKEEALGFVQLSGVQEGGIAEWGFYVRPDAPKGTGRQVGTTALDHAFHDLRLHKVCGQALDTNQASIGFHLALGFSQEGVLRDQCLIHGRYHNLVCFGQLRQEWVERDSGSDNPDLGS